MSPRFPTWCLGMAAAGVLAAAPVEDWRKGNEAYERGDYPAAIEAYGRAADDPAAGANVFFNLGNAYFRAGERGLAALQFERALLLEPGHPEAAANRAFVLRRTGATAPPASALPLHVRDLATAAVCLGCWLLLGAAAFQTWAPHRRRLVIALTATGLLTVAAAGAWLAVVPDPFAPQRWIVVAKGGTRANFAPAELARLAAPLPAGSEVRLIQTRDAWLYIETGSTRGWVPAKALAPLVPPRH